MSNEKVPTVSKKRKKASRYDKYRDELRESLKDNNFNVSQTAAVFADHNSTSKNVLFQADGITPKASLRVFITKIRDEVNLAHQELKAEGISDKGLKRFWIKTKKGSYLVENNHSMSYDDFRRDLKGMMQEYAPKYPKIKYVSIDNPRCLVVDIADLHINKLTSAFETGESTNVELLKKNVMESLKVLLTYAKPFNISSIIFVGGNDVLHVDTTANTTTGGTKQDSCMMWYDAFIEAKKLYIEVIELLMQVAPVHFVFCPSNHDYMSGFQLAQTIEAWFHKCKDVSFDVSPAHRKYVLFGNSLMGFTHGDGPKAEELPDLLKIEAKAEYALAKYCYVYCHHWHHKVKAGFKGKKRQELEKDYRDVKIVQTAKQLDKNFTRVEHIRSANGTDSWHHIKGFQHSPTGVEAFIHDLHKGEIARLGNFY